MTDKTVSERYALALLNVAKKTGKMDVILSELGLIGKVIGEGSFVKRFLESPHVSDEDKKNSFSTLRALSRTFLALNPFFAI